MAAVTEQRWSASNGRRSSAFLGKAEMLIGLTQQSDKLVFDALK